MNIKLRLIENTELTNKQYILLKNNAGFEKEEADRIKDQLISFYNTQVNIKNSDKFNSEYVKELINLCNLFPTIDDSQEKDDKIKLVWKIIHKNNPYLKAEPLYKNEWMCGQEISFSFQEMFGHWKN